MLLVRVRYVLYVTIPMIHRSAKDAVSNKYSEVVSSG